MSARPGSTHRAALHGATARDGVLARAFAAFADIAAERAPAVFVAGDTSFVAARADEGIG